MAFLASVAGNLGSSVIQGSLNSLVAATNQRQSSYEKYLDFLITQAIAHNSFENLLLISNFIDDSGYEGNFKTTLQDWINYANNNSGNEELLCESLIKLKKDLADYMCQGPETTVTRIADNVKRIAKTKLFEQSWSLLGNMQTLLPRSITLGLYKRLACLETGQELTVATESNEHQLDTLLSKTIATPSFENLKTVKNWLETNTINLTLDLEILESLEKKSLNLDASSNGKEFLEDLIKLRQSLRAQLNARGVAAQASQKAQVIFKKQISLLSQTLLAWAENTITIPEHVRLQLHTLLTRFELGDISTTEFAEEFAKIFESVEVLIQGFNISQLFQNLFQQTEKEESLESSIDIRPITSPPPPIPLEELKSKIKEEKDRFIEQTSLFLVFSLVHDFLLPKKSTYFYMSSVHFSMIDDHRNTTSNQRLKETLRGYLQNENVFKRFMAHVLWYILTKVISALVANLCHHHIDAFFDTYISSKNLFKAIVSYLNTYFVILDEAYRRVMENKYRTKDIPEAVEEELNHPSSYGKRSARSFYAKLIRHELKIALGSSLIAKIASFIIGWPLSWIYAPQLIAFRDRQVESFTNSNGYPHGINLVLLKHLRQFKTSLQRPSLTTNTPVKPLSVQDKDNLQALLIKASEKLKPYIDYSQKQLEAALKNNSVKDDIYTAVTVQVTEFASNFIQRLSSNNQLEYLFLELLQQANTIYALDGNQPKRAEEAEVSQEVTDLIEEITNLSARQFIRDLDLFGEQEKDLVNKSITHTNEAINKLLSQIPTTIRELGLDSSSQMPLANLIKDVEEVNSSLKALSSDPRLSSSRKEKITKYNTQLSNIQRALGKVLEEIQEIVNKHTQLEALRKIKEPLASIRTQILSTETSTTYLLENLDFAEIQKKLEEQNVFQFPPFLPKTYADLQKQSQILKEAKDLLANPEGQEQAILDWLKARSTYLQFYQQAWFIRIQKALSRTLTPQTSSDSSNGIPSTPSKTQNPPASALSPRKEMAEDGSSQNQILTVLTNEITAQKVLLENSVLELRNAVAEQITQLNTSIEYREKEINQIANAQANFEKAKNISLEKIQVLRTFNEDTLKTLTVYNTVIFTERQIHKGASSAIDLFGSTLIESLRSFLKKKTTYTHGLIPHVVIPILTNK